MKMQPECVPCLLKRVLYEAELVNPGKRYAAMKEASRIIGKEFDEGVNSAKVASKVHARVYEVIGNKDPYKDLKQRANSAAVQLYKKAEKIIENSDDRLKTAVQISIIGNILDFGIRDDMNEPEILGETFDDILAQGLCVDDTPKMKEYLKKGASILFFTDNCGEIVFDKLLMQEIKKFGVDLTLVVKGEPILTDAMMDDAVEFGLDKIADRICTTGSNAVGIDIETVDPELKGRIEQADLLVAKGMANYESLSDTQYKPIIYIMRTKCWPVATSMGLHKDRNIAKMFE